MASRPSRHGRYDDPYTFDDPYRQEPPSLGRNVGYEYVGTDEPGFHPDSPPPRYESRRQSPDRRKNRTTSPPRRSRRHGEHSPPQHARRSSPHRHSRHHSPTPKAGHNLAGLKHTASQTRARYQDRYNEWSQQPGVQRAQTYGKKGLTFMGQAAAAYMAAQQGEDPRDRGRDPGYPYRGTPYLDPRDTDDDLYPRRRRSRREPSYSPSRSPSPPRRSRHKHADAAGASHRGRRMSYSPSPPPRSRAAPDGRGRRDRHHRSRAHSLSPSPPPKSRGRPRGKSASAAAAFRKGMTDGFKTKESANATRWQMAARAALEAGGMTAFRLRNQPGAWAGEKGAKVATAALGAAAIDAFVDKDPRRSQGGMKGMAQSVVSGLIASKLTGVKSHTNHKGKPRYGY